MRLWDKQGACGTNRALVGRIGRLFVHSGVHSYARTERLWDEQGAYGMNRVLMGRIALPWTNRALVGQIAQPWMNRALVG